MTARVSFVERAKQLAIAVLWIALFAGVALAAGLLLHALTTGRRGTSWWRAPAGPLGVGFLLAALSEELLFRGFPLRRLADAIGPWAAMTVLAVGFGLAHLKNPNATAFSTINVALAGVWLSFAFFSP